jgi:two-component system response regulator AtoC
MMHIPLRRSPHVLIIDDDQGLLESYAVLLEDEFRVYTAATGEDGLACFQREDIDLLLLDLRLPSMDGLEVLRRVKVIDDRVAVIVITAMNEARLAAEAFKLGVAEYLVKPFDIKPTLALLRRILKGRQEEAADVPRQLEEATSPLSPDFLVGRGPQMRQLFTLLGRVAETDATVLISGETGVGKELIARALHQQSRRHAHPFTVVNCAAITEPLAESTLFGHERGAFTGAVTRHRGPLSVRRPAPFFSMKLAVSVWRCRQSCYASFRSAPLNAWGVRQPCTSMCVSLQHQTKIYVSR